ncbi:hypothetical protein GCM10027579_13900 [Calidifontibacter terrae]
MSQKKIGTPINRSVDSALGTVNTRSMGSTCSSTGAAYAAAPTARKWHAHREPDRPASRPQRGLVNWRSFARLLESKNPPLAVIAGSSTFRGAGRVMLRLVVLG